MFTATKIQIMKETQESVNKVYSAVRTRLGSLAGRVSNLEAELKCKAQVVEILEARIAELEKRSSVQPDHTGDSAGQEEPGAPARAHHLPAMEVEEHVVARSEDYGEATPSEVSGGQDDARTTPPIASQEAVIENFNSKMASSEPLTMEDLVALQVRLSKRLAKLAESPSDAESPSASAPMPQSALSSTPTSVIRKVIQMRKVIEDEIKNTEAEILDLSQK